jgi:hypothetical protein
MSTDRLHIGRDSVLGTRCIVLVSLTVALVFASPVVASASEATGQIIGTVTSATTTAAIAGIEVCAAENSIEGELFGHCATTNSSGEYSITGVPAGKYGVGFFAPEGSGLDYITQYYNGKSSVFEAERITVEASKTVPEIDAAMVAGGQITGKVTGAASKAAIAGVQVCASRELGEFGEQCAKTNSSGEYAVSGLASGTYKMHFFSPEGSGLNYLFQYYNDKSSFAEATGVPVSAPGSATGIDAAMIAGGEITGKVTNASSKAALSGIEVCPQTTTGGFIAQCTSTNASGEYTIVGLVSGEYRVQFYPTSGVNYVTQYYNGKESSGEATTVPVTVGKTTPGINAAMVAGGQITGIVTAAATKAALAGVEVCVSPKGGGGGPCTSSNASGEYTLAGLASGEYTVGFTAFQANYVTQYYNGKESSGEATAVPVTVGKTTPGIDAAMIVGGEITGKVTSAATKEALAGLQVCAYPTGGGTNQCASTNPAGEYTIIGLGTGEYTVDFSAFQANYVTQYYNGEESPGEAAAVPVTAGNTTPSIDAAMVVGAQITGKVTSSSSTAALEGIEVCLLSAGGQYTGKCTFSSANGEYAIGGLAGGEYEVEFSSNNGAYFTQYYNGKSSLLEASAVAVSAASTVPGIDAAMVAGGQITGKVTSAASKAGLEGVEVCAEESGELFGRCAQTNSSGQYTIIGLGTGEYSVRFRPQSGNFLSQYYNDKSSAHEENLVPVADSTTTPNIDAALAAGGQITGTVISAASKAGIEDIEACASPASEGEGGGGCAVSGAGGHYTISSLSSGKYIVHYSVFPESGLNYMAQYYNGKPLLSEASQVTVTAGSITPNIDAAMLVGGQITGTVTDASSKAAIKGIQVCASPTHEGESGGCAITGTSGEYTIAGLATGEYTVEFSAPFGSGPQYAEQFYDGKSAFSEATPVAVSVGLTKSAIDAAMLLKGEITGMVTSASSKAALAGIQVCPLSTSGGFIGQCATTNSSGEYKIVGLSTGEYKVQFSVPLGSALNYLSQYYSGKSSLSEASVVAVSVGAVASAVNAEMQAGGEIAGKVTNASTKAAIRGIQVCPSATVGFSSVQCVTTNASGEYTVVGLPTGEYKVAFSSTSGANYVTQYYDGKPSSTEAIAVPVTAGQTKTEIDAAMIVGAEISGKVTDASSKAAIAGIEVCPQPVSVGPTTLCVTTNLRGEYKLLALAAGEYKVQFSVPSFGSALNYVSQYYNGKETSGEATGVAVPAAGSVSGINAAMITGGEITGKVTEAASKNGLFDAEVCIEAPKTSFFSPCVFTNSQGGYTITGLRSGEYNVQFQAFSGGFSTQYYNNKGSASEANPVSVTTGVTTPGVNAVMVVGGDITGTVTAAGTKAPITGVQVCASATGTEPLTRCANTSPSGEYTIGGLSTGTYKVEFNATSQNYVSQYYQGKESSAEATPVSVSSGTSTPGINAALIVGGEITGKVTDASSKAALSGVEVCPLATTALPGAGCTTTNSGGEYTIPGLATGEYKVEFLPNTGANYVPQFYEGKPSLSEATKVSVSTGSTKTGINAALIVGGQITGTVTNATSKAPASGIEVCAQATGGEERLVSQPCATTNSSGEYTIVGQATGEYEVDFNAAGQNYLTQFYNGKPSVAEATKVSVTAGLVKTGISAALIVGGEITGKVIEASTKAVIAGIEVCSSPAEDSAFFDRCTTTNSSGEYTILALTTGQYDVRFTSPSDGYVTQYYNTKTSLTFANAVSVTTGSPTGAIDGELANLPVLSKAPVITGTAQQGHTLTEAHGTWKNNPTEFTYQWERCNSTGGECATIEGATKQTYMLVQADVGHTMRVTETAMNVAGQSAPASSAATVVILPAPPVNTSPPSISGTAQQGQTLTEVHGAWENNPTEFTYQWQRCNSTGGECAAIEGATKQTYVPVAADVTHKLVVTETAGNTGGQSSPAASEPSAVVLPPVPVEKTAPSISGSAVQGQTLTEVHGAWENNPTEFTYQWQRCNPSGGECAAIEGASEQAYLLAQADVGHTIRVQETATNAGGSSAPATSMQSAKVTGAVPVSSQPPTITGHAQQGETLTEGHGKWSNEPTSYTYQWERCEAEGKNCTAIAGAKEQTYVLIAADVSHTIEVAETAKNVTGGGSPASSTQTASVLPAVPVNTKAPTVTGTAVQGQTLTEVHGAWENSPTEYSYQWERCDSEGCTAISGATEQTYLLTSADVGNALEVSETASNAGGAGAPAVSVKTVIVTAAKPVNLTAPSISGHAQQGETLTETHGTWTNQPTSYEYEWLRCNGEGKSCVAISGATEQTYLLTAADVSQTLMVKETARNAGGPSNPASSLASAVVLPPVPVNTGVPKISGSRGQGATLTEEHGRWTYSPTEYRYQWERCEASGEGCVAILGATSQTYGLVAVDVGHTIRVQETAVNAGGPSAPASSLATAKVVASVPVDVSRPTIGGTVQQGQTLVASHGSWTNQPTQYAEQWLRCDSSGANCQLVPGAVNQTYMATSSDVGHTLEVQEVASNAGGESVPTTSVPTSVVAVVPLQAVVGENVDATIGQTVRFDGSGSSPADEITRYRWEFGDGSSGEGANATHVYSQSGVFQATLTVFRGAESSKQALTVTVEAPPGHQVTITVVDASKRPLAGADVLYVGPTGVRIQGLTDGNGNAALAGLPDGTDTVYAYRSGYRPTVGQVTVEAGAGQATISLATGEVATSTLKSHEMTLSEIEAAGIDTSDPANQNVYEFEVRLAFPESNEPPDLLHCYINDSGQFVGECTGGGGGGGTGGVSCSPTECEGGGGDGGGSFVAVPGFVEGHPLIQWLILRGKAAVLKQFFTVSMVVQNLSETEPFKITGGSATLNVPAGMSLAPTASPQSATQSVAAIPPKGSSTANWIVRGDTPGEYYFSAAYHGELEPFKAPIDLQAELAQPLHVWGANALAFNVQADSGDLATGVPYHMRVGITNKADVPLYNVAVSIDANTHEQFIFQPDQQFTNTVSELAPGETVYDKPLILVPDAASAGAFDPALSSAHFVGEEIKPGVGIEAVPPPPLYGISAPTDTPNMVHLQWQSVPGAEGYEVFPTTDLDTPFAEGAESVLSSSSSEAGVTELPGTATNAYIFGSSKEKPKYYAVSALIDGVPTLEFPVITASAGAEPPASSGGGGSGIGGGLGSGESSPGFENGMGAPVPTCPKHSVTLAGGITVEASCFHGSGNALTAMGHIRVNGLDIVASGSVTLNPSTLELDSSGQVDVYAGSLDIYHGTLSWKFTAQLSLKAPGNLKIKGLPIGGEITVSLVPGGVHAVANAMIGSTTFEVSGQIDLTLTLNAGLKLNSFSLELASDVPIKGLLVKKAKLSYMNTSAGDVWEGDVEVDLPDDGPTVEGTLTLINGSVSEVSVTVSGINKPLGEVIFLQSLGLKVDFHPHLAATGSIELSAGPEVDGHTAASLDGSLTADIGNPFVLEASGTLSVVDQKVASAWVKATIPGGVAFKGDISRSFLVINIEGGISGSITSNSFEAQGYVTISAPVVSANGDALVNNTGLAGCASAKILWATLTIGGSHRWSGQNSVFTDSCGFGRLKAALGASSSALPGPPATVAVPPHTRQVNLIVQGTSGSPKVALTHGGETTLMTPNTTGSFGRSVYVALADPANDDTDIAIADPPAGSLQVAAATGQPRLVSVGSALPLPSPDVRTKVSSLGGRRYRLSWSAHKIAGQTLVFEDTNALGQVRLLSTTRSHGQTVFTALDNGASGSQRLRVVVDQDGLTREALAGPVFHPAAVRVAKPHVGVRLEGRTDVITWSAVQNAASYEVSVSTSDGRHLFFAVGARDRSVRIQGAPHVVASVRGVSAGMELGSFGVGRTISQKPKPKNKA